jgi:hypothetical protein
VVANDSYIRESILTPQAKMLPGYGAIMPTFQGQVSEESVMSLIEYIKSLPPAPSARRRRGDRRRQRSTGGSARGTEVKGYGHHHHRDRRRRRHRAIT